jgi:uncharacterized protein YdhG (YjbR/CyaY superfamily)
MNAQRSAKRTTGSDAQVFTAAERAAIQARAKEEKAARRGGKEDGESDLLARIAEMPPADRALAERVHAIVKASAPVLTSKTWYGMPAYAKDGNVVCWFKCAAKFNARYATFGFSDKANLDDGAMFPTEYALKDLTAADEKKLAELLKKAAS